MKYQTLGVNSSLMNIHTIASYAEVISLITILGAAQIELANWQLPER